MMFDDKERVDKARFEKALNAVLDKSSLAVSGKDGSSAVGEGQEVVQSTVSGEGEDEKATKSVSTLSRVMPSCALLFVSVI